MAQGAKPGEGGQLPGHKVYPWVAKTRHSTPGVGLISPPPHHDIYSIEDLAQLIHDLKNANPEARIHVKLVAEVGVGTVAAGVSKAHSDVVLISGHDGGTGASPLTSLKHAGGPWELGLAETQQTLVLNGLRDRIVVQVDGQLKTGRDVVIAALLGAEEFGFATAPLVVSGCIMMRVCHLDTCPVGVATQNPELRARFTGKPEFVETFFEFIAQEVRELLAAAGLPLDRRGHRRGRHHRHLGGRGPLEGQRPRPGAAAAGGDPRRGHDALPEHQPGPRTREGSRPPTHRPGSPRARRREQVGGRSPSAMSTGRWARCSATRSPGDMSSGLPDGTIDLTLTGSAGSVVRARSCPPGVTLRLVGDANDYVGKGLSGGRMIVAPIRRRPSWRADNVIAGNVIGYGATRARSSCGARWASASVCATRVRRRSSRAWATMRCEYMTGGTAVILGRIGRNFAAGMSGG
jgi:glutamate synthase (NADPH/NADH) large chain